MKRTLELLAIWLLAPWAVQPVFAADLLLLTNGQSNYEIVIPDQQPSDALQECIAQTARLLQVAFKANGAEVAIVMESQRDVTKPALLLGNTQFARKHGLDVTTLRDWSYVQRVIGNDILVAGHDHPAKAPTDNVRRPNWDRVGTAKAVVDFARQFMGVRFLYPELPGYTPVSGAARIDLLRTPAIEFLPMKTITVPDSLNVSKTPLLRVNSSHPAGGSFYDLAHNRFPRVDEQFGGHTWERAVPAELFAEHPEYFALISGSRLQPQGGAQYCLSNPDVQERIYRDLAEHLDRGFDSVDLGQPDGFRECQCEKCESLYGTGKDWSEKIWIFNRDVAQRLEESHPGRQVTMMSYILTAAPPKSFQAFPANTCIMLTGTNEEDIAPWRGIEVPRGFTGYVYNWCPNLGTRYTPMRTPGYIEQQVQRLAENRIQSLYRDGPGQLFGLEGPVYYTMGRMFDDPQNNHAKDLLPEFCEAAFESKSIAFYMRAFYDELYHAIALYSDQLGTRNAVWTYKLLPTDTRGRKTVTDPFQLIAFLYTPRVLAAMESHLAQAEKLATQPKSKTRLALVRTEFDYLKHFARVVHLHQAWQMVPDQPSLQRLLDAIDARNAFIATLFIKEHQKAWNHVLFPFPGHDAKHLRLAYDGYQEPYANTCFNWDTQALRNTPPPGRKQLTIARTTAKLTLDSPEWQNATSHELTLLPPLHTLPRKTTIRLLYDEMALHIRAEAELGLATQFPAYGRDRLLTNQEAIDVYLAPNPAQSLYYRFVQGANVASKYDALNGRITDPLDPRFGKDDLTWNGDWTSETRVDADHNRWHAHLVVPFATVGAETPTRGIAWKANFGRNYAQPRDVIDRAIWSSSLTSVSIDDTAVMGEIVFE
jgi:hypothetical protein